ncbi:MAG TPA: Holliday junction branch migration DNA helicase RuvB [Candidatus Colwellbacteria bacterium]|jgi:Holliday junction DNA helicase RuvB|nr:Holliday junction branch migration DNA helicase RuvB [Candidatus Colwellbacteria bacterium]HQA95828.1 Holliday junction branch migration DNA helicase RuvB [Candidatus Colwellbacteria bacterium]
MKKANLQLSKNDDLNVDLLLRPRIFEDYVGQETIKKALSVILGAAKQRNEAPDHLLFYGPAGLGKTTLAHLVAFDLGAQIKETSGPALEKTGDLAAVLTNLEPRDVLFIDEAHRLSKPIEEVLYPAMETRKLNIVLGKGPAARTISLDLPPFTLIAATTRVNMLSNPLRSRFGASFRLDYYSLENIESIIEKSAKILDIGIEESGIARLAAASRFTPRIANRLLKRSRDFAEMNKIQMIDGQTIKKVLELLDIDEFGLEYIDRKFLGIIENQFKGGPVGLNTLSAALGEEKGVIEEVYEPYLMKIGFLKRTSGGRVVTDAAKEHLARF